MSNVDEASPNVELTTASGGLFCDKDFKSEWETQIHIEGNHSEKKIEGNSSSDKTSIISGGILIDL